MGDKDAAEKARSRGRYAGTPIREDVDGAISDEIGFPGDGQGRAPAVAGRACASSRSADELVGRDRAARRSAVGVRQRHVYVEKYLSAAPRRVPDDR